jgi:hypothetical protein
VKFDSIVSLTILVVFVLIVDSTIVKTYGYSNSRVPGVLDQAVFAFFILLFIISNIVILAKIRHVKIHPIIDKFYPMIFINQCLIAIFLILLLFQMNIYSHYDRIIFLTVVFLSFVSSVIFSAALVIKLFQWFKFYRNHIVLLYGLAFSLLIVKFLVGWIYVSQEILSHSSVVVPSETREMIMGISNINAILSNILNNTYDYVSVVSYITIWITTILLLRKYSNKFGKFKYWILVSIPLLYYLAENRILLLTPFSSITLIAPVQFGIIYTLFFSGVQLVGGLLFGLAFFTAAKKVNQENISNSLKISGIGIIILIGSNEIFGVYVGSYPPYGLMTIAFMPLASFLLLAGILSSAVLIASNNRTRSELYKMAEDQPALFRDIGVAEMESVINKRVERVLKSATLTPKNDENYIDDIDEQKKYIEEVLTEIQKSKFEK